MEAITVDELIEKLKKFKNKDIVVVLKYQNKIDALF